jgi:hypothetical protein
MSKQAVEQLEKGCEFWMLKEGINVCWADSIIHRCPAGVRVILRDTYIRTTARPVPKPAAVEDAVAALRQVQTTDPRAVEQYALDNTRTRLAWGRTTGSRDIIVAVVDTGCGEFMLHRQLCIEAAMWQL